MVDQYEVVLWSIERRNFQWSWTTPNTVFRVMSFLCWKS